MVIAAGGGEQSSGRVLNILKFVVYSEPFKFFTLCFIAAIC